MIDEQQHIVHRVLVDVDVGDEKLAYKLKDNIDKLLSDKIFPIIENELSTISENYPEGIIRLDKLSLELNGLEFDNGQQIANIVWKEMEKQLNVFAKENALSDSNTAKATFISPEKSDLEAFLYFVEHGKSPWWKNDIKALINDSLYNIIEQPDFHLKLKKILHLPQARQRLSKQLDDEQLLAILYSNAVDKVEAKKHTELKDILITIPSELKTVFWAIAVEHFAFEHKSIPKAFFRNLDTRAEERIVWVLETMTGEVFMVDQRSSEQQPLTKKLSGQQAHEHEFENASKEFDRLSPSPEGILVKNTGIVLLYPFLEALFKKLDFLDSESTLKEEKKTEAAHLLHYISTKQLQPYESDLLLEKHLCDIPYRKPIERNITLSEAVLQEAENVLISCLGHWSALKSESPDALRSTFLQREGKLINEETKTRLMIERKAQDILLDQLPWGIHLIKLPWLKDLLFVEW